jgi:hypothetical protein
MPRRHILVGIVVSAVAAGTTALVAASPVAMAANKPKKATSCTGTIDNALGGGGASKVYGASVTCNGTFSAIALTTNKPITTGNTTGVGLATHPYSRKTLSCRQSGANAITCTGIPAKDTHVNVNFRSTETCTAPVVTASVTVNGKTFPLKGRCE